MGNSFRLRLGLQILVQNIAPWALDGILLSIFRCDEVILEPLFSPISSDPLDSGLALILVLLRIRLVKFVQIWGQVQSSIATALPATFPYRFFSSHNIKTERLQNSERLPSAGQTRTGFRRFDVTL